MGFVNEFRDFAVKGNALDMAVGIIIGAAFNKIVNSIVSDIIMPPVGLLIGGVDFKGHPDLRPIIVSQDFYGLAPFRKDFDWSYNFV